MKVDKFLDYASKRYYNGTPIITDEEFDSLARKYNYQKVGYDSQDTVEHLYPMSSLQNVFIGEDFIPSLPGATIETPKLDGAAVDLLYVNGTLTVIITRGDGKRGKDISHLIPVFPAPRSIKTTDKFKQVTGEVVAPKEIKNARNYASGALNLKSTEEFKTRDLTFVAYGLQPYEANTYCEDLIYLNRQKFHTVLHVLFVNFPTDGKVIRLDSNKLFDDMGSTSHHPKGAYALKERKAGLVTKLLDVTWQVGKSGAVSPVAILQPIEIDGALISRATLHNIKYIRELNLEIGCEVEVVRAGEIIPRVVRRV